jgi:hypothetical protein
MAAAGKRKRVARGKDEEAETQPREVPEKDLAAKKHHVRELAMAGRFQEVRCGCLMGRVMFLSGGLTGRWRGRSSGVTGER